MDQRQVLQKIYCQVLRLRPGHKRGTNLQEAREVWSPRLREVWLMISAQSATFGCLLLSLPIRAALGVPFWRGFLGIHFKSMYIDFLSSHRNCVQLSQPALAYATASLLPPCPRSHFFLSSDFREQTMAACAAGIPFVSWAETTRDFRSRTGLFRPHQEVLGVPSLAIFPDISGHGFSAMGNP